jgi:hypothetical protein
VKAVVQRVDYYCCRQASVEFLTMLKLAWVDSDAQVHIGTTVYMC